MPQTKKQEIVYTVMMVCVMVYGMVCYNIALDVGGMQNFIFAAALSELPIMGVIKEDNSTISAPHSFGSSYLDPESHEYLNMSQTPIHQSLLLLSFLLHSLSPFFALPVSAHLCFRNSRQS